MQCAWLHATEVVSYSIILHTVPYPACTTEWSESLAAANIACQSLLTNIVWQALLACLQHGGD